MKLPHDPLAVCTIVPSAKLHFPLHGTFITHCSYGIMDFASIEEMHPTLQYALGAAVFVNQDPNTSFERYVKLQPNKLPLPMADPSVSSENLELISHKLQQQICLMSFDIEHFTISYKTKKPYWGKMPIYLYQEKSEPTNIFFLHTFNNTKVKRFCQFCLRLVTITNFHTHKCIYAKCRTCARIISNNNITPFLGGQSQCSKDIAFQAQCTVCNQYAQNLECFEIHSRKPRISCNIYGYCQLCCATVRKHNKHVCGEFFCKQCFETHETGPCYIKRNRQYKQLWKRKKQIFAYCMQIIQSPLIYILSRIDQPDTKTFVCQNENGFQTASSYDITDPMVPTLIKLDPGLMPSLDSLLLKKFCNKQVHIFVQELDFERVINCLRTQKVTISDNNITFKNIVFCKSTSIFNFDLHLHSLQLQRIPSLVPDQLWKHQYDPVQFLEASFDVHSSPQLETWFNAFRHAVVSKLNMKSYLLSVLVYNFQTYKLALTESNQVFLKFIKQLEKEKHKSILYHESDSFFGKSILPKKASLFAYSSTAEAGYATFKSCLSDRDGEQIHLPPQNARFLFLFHNNINF